MEEVVILILFWKYNYGASTEQIQMPTVQECIEQGEFFKENESGMGTRMYHCLRTYKKQNSVNSGK